MKKQIIVLLCSVIMDIAMAAQAAKRTETIKVYGNCEMCKATIESVLKKKDGIISKKWDVKAKLLTVTYDSGKITIKEIGQKIADVGYDNEYSISKDEVYNKLHHCCQYDRPQKDK